MSEDADESRKNLSKIMSLCGSVVRDAIRNRIRETRIVTETAAESAGDSCAEEDQTETWRRLISVKEPPALSVLRIVNLGYDEESGEFSTVKGQFLSKFLLVSNEDFAEQEFKVLDSGNSITLMRGEAVVMAVNGFCDGLPTTSVYTKHISNVMVEAVDDGVKINGPAVIREVKPNETLPSEDNEVILSIRPKQGILSRVYRVGVGRIILMMLIPVLFFLLKAIYLDLTTSETTFNKAVLTVVAAAAFSLFCSGFIFFFLVFLTYLSGVINVTSDKLDRKGIYRVASKLHIDSLDLSLSRSSTIMRMFKAKLFKNKNLMSSFPARKILTYTGNPTRIASALMLTSSPMLDENPVGRIDDLVKK